MTQTDEVPNGGKPLRDWTLWGIAIFGVVISLYQSSTASAKAEGQNETQATVLADRVKRLEDRQEKTEQAINEFRLDFKDVKVDMRGFKETSAGMFTIMKSWQAGWKKEK